MPETVNTTIIKITQKFLNNDFPLMSGHIIPSIKNVGKLAAKKSKILTAGRYDYFNLLVDNTKILQHIFDIIQ